VCKVRRGLLGPALDNTTGAPRDDLADITALMRQRVQRIGWPNSLV
jgi:hypothetical protein